MSHRETKAFEILMRENARMLMAYLHGMIRDNSAVDDLFQETMVVAWRRLDDCDLSLPFGPWLRGIASRLVVAHYRKQSSLPVFLSDTVLAEVDRQFESISERSGDTWGEKVEALNDCIAALPETSRRAVRSRYMDGMRVTEVAEQLSLPVEACKKRIQRARLALADCLKQKGVMLSRGASR